MLDSIKQTLRAGKELKFTDDNQKQEFKKCSEGNNGFLKQIVASAFLCVRDETLETYKVLIKLNIVNSSQCRIFEYEGVNDTFILYLEGRIKKNHFVNNMLELCYASGSAIRPNGDDVVHILEKRQTIQTFISENAKLQTLLHYVIAAQSYSAHEMEKILNSALIFGYNINAVNNAGETTLIFAIRCKNTGIVEALLKYKDVNTGIQDNRGNTALEWAIYKSMNNNYDIARKLLEYDGWLSDPTMHLMMLANGIKERKSDFSEPLSPW